MEAALAVDRQPGLTLRAPLSPTSMLAPGIELGRLGFGGAEIGNLHRALDEVEARAVLDAALAAGMTLIDTAPGYGSGLSELRVGAFVRDNPGRGLILSTKVGRYLLPGAAAGAREFFAAPLPFQARFDYGYDGVMRAFEQSLLRLGTDAVDLLFVHDLDRMNHGDAVDGHVRDLLTGGMCALGELRASGAARLIGLAVNEPGLGADLLDAAAFDVALLASRYTLLDQSAADRFLPACAAHGVRLVAGGVFNSGILASGATAGARFDYRAAAPAIVHRVVALEAVCARHGVPLAAAALQFVLAHPSIATVLIGTSRASRIAGCRAAADTDIPTALWQELRAEGLIPAEAPVPAG